MIYIGEKVEMVTALMEAIVFWRRIENLKVIKHYLSGLTFHLLIPEMFHSKNTEQFKVLQMHHDFSFLHLSVICISLLTIISRIYFFGEISTHDLRLSSKFCEALPKFPHQAILVASCNDSLMGYH